MCTLGRVFCKGDQELETVVIVVVGVVRASPKDEIVGIERREYKWDAKNRLAR